jgi:hypothetical protein
MSFSFFSENHMPSRIAQILSDSSVFIRVICGQILKDCVREPLPNLAPFSADSEKVEIMICSKTIPAQIYRPVGRSLFW